MTVEDKAVAEYVAEVARLAKTGKATEHSFRGALAALIDALAPGLKAVNEPKRTDCGAPDYIVQNKSGLAVFYVEAKDLGDSDLDGKKRTGHKEQFDRYKAALDTIVFTDYLDFHLYRRGQLASAVRIADWDNEGKVSGKPAAYADLAALLADAAVGEPQKIDGAKRLAGLMAGKARMLQSAALAYLRRVEGTARSASAPYRAPLFDMMLDFRKMLMPEVGAEEFSDIFAQTLTYGMFAARLNDPTPEDFSRYEAMALIPKTNPFLKRLFGFIASDLESELTWIVDDLADLFRAAAVADIMRDYGKAQGGADPMLHFYEDFLAAYDGDLRKKRGVWYTPIQVVRFIVAAADWALRTRFGLPDGLADSSKTEIEVEETAFHGKKLAHKVKKTVHRVQLLDPATGTGTFIAEALRQVHAKFAGNEGMWPGYVENDLLPRLNGFELLMASYTMAHIKLDMALRECCQCGNVANTNSNSQLGTGNIGTGNTGNIGNNSHARFRIFLTDSLSDWHKELPGGLFAAALGAEQEGADEVKRDIPVMVVVGNPPYSGESQNKGEWIMRLMEDYKVEPGGKERLKERNPKWLNDDYVKFIRLAEHYVEKNGEGIVAYITPHGFLDNPTFRGMRWHLMQTFDEIWTLNLHGNSKKKEVAPDGGKDECVFDIMQGVAITLFVKCCQCENVANANFQCQSKRPKELKTGNIGTGNNSTLATIPRPCRIYYADLWGKKAAKLAALDSATMDTIDWQELHQTEPMLFFTPKDTAGEEEWNAGFAINELFGVGGSGITSAHDEFVSGSTDVLVKRFEEFRDSKVNENLYKKFNVKEKSGWDIHRGHSELQGCHDIEKFIKPFAYRLFDRRHIFYQDSLVWRSVRKIFDHFLLGTNVGIVVLRGFPKDSPPAFVTDAITEHRYWSCSGMQGTDYIFPLYLYEENMGKVERRVNLDKDIVAKIAAAVAGGQSSIDTIRNFLCGEPVATLTGHEFEGVVGHRAIRDAIYAGYDRVNYVARNAQLGEVRLTKSGITDSMAHGFGRAKLSAFAAIPEMIERGKVVQHNENWKGRGYESFVLAAPIQIGGEQYCAFIVVNSTKEGERRFYLHEVGRIADIKKMAEGLRSGSSGDKPALSRTLGDIKSLAYSLLGVNGAFEKNSSLTPIDIFDYIYGILHSPAYRTKFKEFLKSDFPRIPYPKDAEEFALYRDAGHELRMAHLMLDPPPTLSEPTARFPVPGSNVVENVASVKVLPISNSNSQLETGNNGNTSICRVYINPTQYFDNVPLAAYEQAIGGYYPAEKWLKDRKGRALTQDDLRHYQRIILALVKTCEIMKTLH